MTRSRGILPVPLLLALGLWGCAGGGMTDRAELSWDAGIATQRDAQDKPIRVLQNHLYEIERQEQPPNIMILTRWKQRLPFDDEREEGVEMAQTRFIVEARPRQRNPDGTDIYTVRVRVENQVRMFAGGDWVARRPSREFRSYAAGVAGDIRAELQTGIRIIGMSVSAK